jgi:hypothetical protein
MSHLGMVVFLKILQIGVDDYLALPVEHLNGEEI